MSRTKEWLMELEEKPFKYEIEGVFKGLLYDYIKRGKIEPPTKETFEKYLDRLYWNCGDIIIKSVQKGIEEEVINYKPKPLPNMDWIRGVR